MFLIRSNSLKKYKSEIGLSFYLVVTLITIIIVLSLIILLMNSIPSSEIIILIVAYTLVFLAYYFSILYPLFNTNYVIQDETLIVRSGFYKKVILRNQIVEITEKKSFNREPALSTRRLYIKYREDSAMCSIGISPKNKEDFLRKLGIYGNNF